MSVLNRLLLADLRGMWRQGLAISLLLACGIATFVMSTSSMRSLETSRNRYYNDYRFADVFAYLTRAPRTIANELGNIPGVAQVQTRIAHAVLLNMPGMPEPASCRLLSLDDNWATAINRIGLRRGRVPEPSGDNEVIVSEPFAEAHSLVPGDALNVNMNGRNERLRIVGIGFSPEFIYAVQPGLLLTDNRRFGILWMPRRQMEAAFNMEGAFNNLSISLQRRASQNEVLFQIDRILAPFGGRGAYGRKDQESHSRLADEMHQMRSMAYVTPAIFLAVAAFLFNIVLSRLVNQQKEQIATLRAFGYTPRELAAHYFKLLTVLAVVGSIIGCIVGWRMSWWMTDLYARFFRFPKVAYEFGGYEACLAVLIGFVAACFGGFSAVRRVLRLQPATAMRPESPRTIGASLLASIGCLRSVSPMTRMIIRRLEASPRSTALSILGIALGVAVLVLGSFMEDTIGFVLDVQFGSAQRQDVMLTFNESLSSRALYDIQRLPGVARVEAFRTVPVRLRHGTRTYRLALMGLEESPVLFRVLDERQQPVQLPPRGGLTISKKLAEVMGVGLGDDLVVEVLEAKRAPQTIRVSAVFSNFTDPGAYLYRSDLHRLMQESERLSGAFLAVDSCKLDQLYATVKETPSIAAVLDNNQARRNFRDQISNSTQVMRWVNAVFGSIIAFGVIYNAALITLAESGRDLATLRVIGFSRREVSYVLLGELAVLVTLAIPLGLPIGYGFAYLATLALDTDSHRFPLVVQRHTFAYATSVILIAAFCSGLIVRRMLNRLDLLAVLKVKVS